MLGGGAFHALLDEARGRYRYIVIDSPPVLAASEALVVAKAADGTLLCTMRDISRVGQVRQANERLRTAGARSLGAVFSGVPPHNYSYKYGGYYNSPYSRRTWTSNDLGDGRTRRDQLTTKSRHDVVVSGNAEREESCLLELA